MSRPPQISQAPSGHPSRRDNHSISSTASGSTRSERGSRHTSPAVESAVTRLLVSIKQLLEALTLWSQLRVDEGEVSNVYVRLGNDFNAAVAAFAIYNIDMAELVSVPDDLRTVLEQCLAEEATAENLEIYLPSVRQIITNLLQGLRGKQSIYRRIVSDHRHKSGESTHERTDSRSSRSVGSSRKDGKDGSNRSHWSRQASEEERSETGSVSRRSGGRRRDPGSQYSSQVNGNGDFVGGFAPTIAEHPTSQSESSTTTSYHSQPSDHFESPGQAERIDHKPSSSRAGTPNRDQEELPPHIHSNTATNADSSPPQPPSAPASMKRYSLVDKPLDKPPSPPAVVVELTSPIVDQNGTSSPPLPETPPIDPPPAVARSLAALKSNDVVLERRASKRFSTYNFTKLTGASTTRERSLRGNANHPNRRSVATNASNLTPGELAVLTEEGDEEEGLSILDGSSRQPAISRTTTPDGKRTPTLSRPPASRTPEPKPTPGSLSFVSAPTPPDPSRITVFLQLGREVKKTTVEPGLTFSSLRVLFVDKFSYNPGLENFPAIYIRDPSSGVQYELEDTDEVKEKCLLSLNIEPLDQIKQHIDTQISSLSSDIKELKSVVSSNARMSSHLPDIVAHPLAESTPMPNRPTDRQFQTVARRLSRFAGETSISSMIQVQPMTSPIYPQMTGQSLQAQMTGASMMSDYTSRVVTDLKTQFDEVQNLRRDIGIMRQLYTEFMKSTKESLGNLRTQTQSVKQLANSNVGGARAYIDSGKKKLDVRTQNALTEVEKLQDIIENIKDDVIKRQVTPNQMYFKSVRKDLDSISTELASLSEHINTIKPMWKKTWEEELQNIVEEQGFLTHQEEFLADLKEDHKAMMQVYGHVEKVITLRKPNGPGRVRNRGFRPAPPQEGQDGLNLVMLEIRGAAVDPEKRLKAIEANQRNREKDLASRSDDLQSEIVDFVSQKKLKMTGGAEETERVRQKRSDMTLKAMFTGGSASSFSLESPTSASGRGEAPYF